MHRGDLTQMDYSEVKNVGIIGAGVAGLTTAKMLLAQGVRCTVFERSSKVGGVWTVGYSNFGVQVQKDIYEFPDYPLPKDAPDFTPGPVVQRYLADYANHFGVTPHIRFDSTVVDMARRDDDGWTVVSCQGDQEHRDDFDLVVVAIGLYSSSPYIPPVAGREAFAGEILDAVSVEPLKAELERAVARRLLPARNGAET